MRKVSRKFATLTNIMHYKIAWGNREYGLSNSTTTWYPIVTSKAITPKSPLSRESVKGKADDLYRGSMQF